MKNFGIILTVVVIIIGGWMVFKNKDIDVGTEDNDKTSTSEMTDDSNSTDDTSGEMIGSTGTTGSVEVGGATTGGTVGGTTTSPVKEFTVTGSSFKFVPATMTVNKGDKVRILFVNSDGFHDFKIDEFNVATKKIASGEQDTVEFVADKTGTFEYYCSVGTHRQMGMKGTLTVK